MLTQRQKPLRATRTGAVPSSIIITLTIALPSSLPSERSSRSSTFNTLHRQFHLCSRCKAPLSKLAGPVEPGEPVRQEHHSPSKRPLHHSDDPLYECCASSHGPTRLARPAITPPCQSSSISCISRTSGRAPLDARDRAHFHLINRVASGICHNICRYFSQCCCCCIVVTNPSKNAKLETAVCADSCAMKLSGPKH